MAISEEFLFEVGQRVRKLWLDAGDLACSTNAVIGSVRRHEKSEARRLHRKVREINRLAWEAVEQFCQLEEQTRRENVRVVRVGEARRLVELDRRRSFSQFEREQIFLKSGGRCQACGEQLGCDWHADHRQPHCEGGRTEVANGRALCAFCNLSKGAMSAEAFQSRRLRR